jgi:multiple antibiotic resistance protein
MRLLGPQFGVALTRLGVIFAALAAQFVIDGVKENFGL